MHSEDEIDYGRGPITIIVRWTPADRRAVARMTQISAEEIAHALDVPQMAWCQRIGPDHHRYWLALTGYNAWLELHVCYHSMTDAYQVIDAHLPQLRYGPPEEEGPNTLRRELHFRLIDIEQGGRENRATQDQSDWYDRVEELPLSALTAPEVDRDIWTAYLDAQMQLVTALESPYAIIWPPKRENGTTQPGKGNAHHDIRLTFRLANAGPVKAQNDHLEKALLQHKLKKADQHGGQLQLTRAEIAKLDKLLAEEFAGEWRRQPRMRVVTKIQPQGRRAGLHTKEQFDVELATRIREHKLKVNYNSEKQMISFDIDSWEQLDETCTQLERWGIFAMTPSPRSKDYWFKVELEAVQKSEEEVAKERLRRLSSAEFVLELPVKDGKPPKTIYTGKLDGRKSNLQQLVLRIPQGHKDDRENAKAILDLLEDLESKERPTHIRANLTGDRAKLSWLEEAIHKVNSPKESPNGQPVNEKLGDFLFDSSRARPVYDRDKQTLQGDTAQLLRRRQLFN